MSKLRAHGNRRRPFPAHAATHSAPLAEQVRKHARQVVKTLFLAIGAVARLGIFAIIVMALAFLSREASISPGRIAPFVRGLQQITGC